MYICLCNAITDRQIEQAAQLGARSPADLAQHLGVGLGCGRCVSCAETVLGETLAAMASRTEKLAA
jgi:bacterioferritin-associated ferredoxin